jgi:hypothetical protein
MSFRGACDASSWRRVKLVQSPGPVTLACPGALECSPSSLFRDAGFATVDVHVGIDENTQVYVAIRQH